MRNLVWLSMIHEITLCVECSRLTATSSLPHCSMFPIMFTHALCTRGVSVKRCHNVIQMAPGPVVAVLHRTREQLGTRLKSSLLNSERRHGARMPPELVQQTTDGARSAGGREHLRAAVIKAAAKSARCWTPASAFRCALGCTGAHAARRYRR